MARIRALGWAIWDLHFGLPLAPEIAGHFAGVDDALTQPVGRVTEVGLFTAPRQPRAVAGAFAALART